MNLEKKLFNSIKKAAAILTLGAVLVGCQPHVSSKPDNPENPASPTPPQNPPVITNPISNYDYTTITRKVASQTIEALVGGSVEVTDITSYLQGTKLIIPIGALSSNTEISVGEVDNPPELPYGLNYVGSAINLEPDGINFNKNINIKIPYTDELLSDAGISDENNLKLYSYNKSTKNWEQINVDSIDTTNNILTAEINHFSYYAITCLNGISPSDLGTPQPGDLVYSLGAFWDSGNFYLKNNWMPGHVGVCVGEKVFDGVPYNVIHAIATGVTRSYFNPISNFSGENIFMGAREPKNFALTSQQREVIVNYVESQVGKPYAWAQTKGALFGMLRGSLVKGPDSFNCVGLAEKAYEIAGVNNGEGLTTYWQEEFPEQPGGFLSAALTPAEHYNSTKPASGIISNSPSGNPASVLEKIVFASQDSFVTKNGYSDNNISYSVNDLDYLEVWKIGSGSNYVLHNILMQFPLSSIPQNSKVSSAKLKLYGSGVNNSDFTGAKVGIKKLNLPWDEFTKWNDSLFDSAGISSISVLNETWYEWDLTSLVQQWVNGTQNYGVGLYSGGNTSNAKFKSSEYSDSTKRPRLIISYQE